MSTLSHFFVVGVGGAIGAMARHGLNSFTLNAISFNQLCTKYFAFDIPYTTLTANILGGLLMGILAGCFAHFSYWSYELRLLLTVGILGGFTTFSSFSLETILMAEKNAWGAMLLYIILSLLGSILATAAGLLLVRLIARTLSTELV